MVHAETAALSSSDPPFSCVVTMEVSGTTYICLKRVVLGVWHGYYIRKRRRRKATVLYITFGVFINKTCKHS